MYNLFRLFVLITAIGVASLYQNTAEAQSIVAGDFARSTLNIETDEKTHTFSVEIAKTDRQQRQGLMFRRQLAADAGMLFIYPAPQVLTMWMKNTYISLDMLFIADNGQITSIAENTVPLTDTRISSGRDVRGVLEIVGGLAAKLGLQPGDIVRHPAFGQ